MFNQVFGEEGGKRIAKWTATSLIFLSLFLLVKILIDLKKLPNAGREVYPQSTIMVSGEGEAFAIPDIASFSFSVTETAKTVEAAQGLLDAKIAKATGVLKEAGIEEKDIKTTGYNVYPKYEYSNSVCPQPLRGMVYDSVNSSAPYYCPPDKQILTGYEVTQSISVKVRDIEKAGDLVSKIGAVNVSNISGVEFTVDNREQYVSQAREEAIKKAKEQAKILSKQLGVRLGKILYYNENGNYPIYYGMDGKGGGMMETAVSSALPARAILPQGETKITSQVTITYEIR